MPKVVLVRPGPWPIPHGLMRPTGTVLVVSDDEVQELVEAGMIVAVEKVVDQSNDDGAQDDDGDDDDLAVEKVVNQPDDDGARDDAPAKSGKVYPELPKKTQGVNAWKEYARLNEIDIRGISEKAEIMGHVMKVVNS